MSAVAIEHTLGKVFVKRDGKKQAVDAKFTPDADTFSLKDGDRVITGKDGYVVEISEYKDGKYSSQICLCPNSQLTLDITTTISKIHLKKGSFRLLTNAPLEIPHLNVEYIFEEFPQLQSTGKEKIFSLVKISDKKVIFANKGFPVDLVHKKTNKKVRLKANEQVVATPEKIKKEKEVSQDMQNILSKTMEIAQNKINSLTMEMQLGYYQSLEETQNEMAKALKNNLNQYSLASLKLIINGWENGLKKELEQMSVPLKGKTKPLIEAAIKQWKELAPELIKQKKGSENKKEKDIKENIEELIKEIRRTLPGKLAAEHEERLRQYLKLTKSKTKKKKSKKKKTKSKQTELDKKLNKLNKEVEEGLAKLSKEIEENN